MRALYLFCVGLHLLAAMTWIGGMAFMMLVLVPVVRRPEAREARAAFLFELAVRFRTIGWGALVTLVVTGAGNLWFHGFGVADVVTGHVFDGPWGRTLEDKLGLVAVIFVVSAAHDFWLGPRAARIARQRPDAKARERFRTIASWIGRVNFLLALAVLALALQLVR